MIVVPFKVGGRVRLLGRRRDGRRRLIQDWYKNLIPDYGLDLIATSKTYLDACQVGLSAEAPRPEQASLIEPVAGTTNRTAANSSAANATPWRGFSQILYQFDVGAINGLIREIGIGPSATLGSQLYSRSMVRNAAGRAVGARVLSDESLEVEYEPSTYAPTGDVVGTIEIDNVEYAYLARAALASTAQHWAPYRAGSFASAGQAVQGIFDTAAGANCIAYSGAIGAITSSPGGDNANVSSVGNLAYEPGSFKRVGIFDFDFTQANFDTGIRSLMMRLAAGTGTGGNSLGAYQVELTPPVPKTSDLAFQFIAGIQWGRR